MGKPPYTSHQFTTQDLRHASNENIFFGIYIGDKGCDYNE